MVSEPVEIRGVMIRPWIRIRSRTFSFFVDPGSGFRSSEKQNHNTYRCVMLLALDPDPESDFQPFSDSEFGFRSSKK